LLHRKQEVPLPPTMEYSRALCNNLPMHYPFSATYCIALSSSISDSQSNTRTQCARLAHAVITRQPRTQEDNWLARVNWWSWAQCSKLLRMDNALVGYFKVCENTPKSVYSLYSAQARQSEEGRRIFFIH
jgi:hypothetical protein